MEIPWSDLDVALNESSWLDLRVDEAKRRAAGLFDVLTLPEVGDPPAESRLVLVFQPIGRLFVSLTDARQEPGKRQVSRVTIDQVSEVVRGFGGCPVYGWDFFDRPDQAIAEALELTSLDMSWSPGGDQHSIQLFQEGNEPPALALEPENGSRLLVLRLWFDHLSAFTPTGEPVSLDAVAADGRRWWTAMREGDPRTRQALRGGGSWIVPAAPEG